MEWSLKNMENLEFPRVTIDTLVVFEERIQEISQGSLFKGTVIDFDNFGLGDGGESCGYRKINRRVGGNTEHSVTEDCLF